MITKEEARITTESVWSAEYVENRDMVILMLDAEVRKRADKGETTASIDISMKKLKHLSMRFWFELKDDIKEYGYDYAEIKHPRFWICW